MINKLEYTFPHWGPFVFETTVDDELIKILLHKGRESKEKNLDNRKHLAGQIEREYYYTDYDEWFKPIFEIYVNGYLDAIVDRMEFPFVGLGLNCAEGSKLKWTLEDLWINFQRQGEYNPLHNHKGHLSFVIYLQVPEEIVNEDKITKGVYNNEGPGRIVFNYGEKLPFNISGFNKLPKKGDLFIFPSWLKHFVYAFKSNVERISVSGNIRISEEG